jgi:hypothetical protein
LRTIFKEEAADFFFWYKALVATADFCRTALLLTNEGVVNLHLHIYICICEIGYMCEMAGEIRAEATKVSKKGVDIFPSLIHLLKCFFMLTRLVPAVTSVPKMKKSLHTKYELEATVKNAAHKQKQEQNSWRGTVAHRHISATGYDSDSER